LKEILKMNKKGELSLDIVMEAVIFFLGFYIFLVIYDPIANSLLFPILDNADKIAYGPVAKLVILIIPVIIAIMGIVLLVKRLSAPPPPQAGYYG
jgi:hypothetical protein